jgi:transcriptional regulator with XRE-family HTH domain
MDPAIDSVAILPRPSLETPLLTMQLETVGEIVRVLRSRLGLEQLALAHACGWRDASPVSRIEKDHIHPTRRTLVKLANNLANPAVTGASAEIRAWLFLAAGILPTVGEVDELGDRLPHIESLPHPAWVRDFGWYLWRSNEWFMRGIGLPERHIGRNYIEMFFEEGGSVRTHLGDLWGTIAPGLVAHFRQDTARWCEHRWYAKLRANLGTMSDFEEFWNTPPGRDPDAVGWSHTSLDGGMVGTMHARLAADPRLIIRQVVPESSDGRNEMLKLGALHA